MATIKDIARAAGVSQGTVSNVLNGRDNVTSDKIQRVMQAVDELGYTINEKAQILRKGTTRTLAAVLPNLFDKPYMDFFSSFRQVAERRGYWVDLYTTNDDPVYEKKLAAHLRSRMTEGVAVYSALPDGSTPYFDAGFSRDDILYISRRPPFPAHFIGFDFACAGREMAHMAARRGYTRIALLIGSLTQSSKRDFHDAFISTLHMLVPECEVSVRTTNISCRYKNAVRLFSRAQPQAVFTENVALAQVMHNVYQNFFHQLPVDFYTMSPSSFLPEKEFILYESDYRMLGKLAAQRLIDRSQDAPEVQVLASKGFSTWPTRRVPPTGKVLSVATMSSPTTRALQSLVNLYEDCSGTRIRLVEMSSNSLYNVLSSWDASTPYDIVRLDLEWMPRFSRQVLAPLRSIDPGIEQTLSGFLPNTLDRCARQGGELYAFPGTPSVQLLFYRRDLFEDTQLKRLYFEKYKAPLVPPRTFAEFNRIAAFFTHSCNPASPVNWGASLVTGENDVAGVEFLVRYFSHASVLCAENGVLPEDTDAALAALRELSELQTYAEPQNYTWWTQAAQSFAQGGVAMSLQLINHVSDFVGPDSMVTDKIGWAMVPGGNPIWGGSVLGISRWCTNQPEALDFLKWLSRDDIATANMLLGGMSASVAAFENSEVVETYPWMPFARDAFAHSHNVYYAQEPVRTVDARRLQSLIGAAVRRMLAGEFSAEEALDEMQHTCAAALQ